MAAALLRVLLYIAAVVLPVVLATFLGAETGGFVFELGKNTALMAFVIIILQVVIAARIKWIERAFGLDILIRYHKHMAVFAAALLVAHPLLLAAGGGGLRLLIGLDLPWYIWLGKATLVLVLVNVVVSAFQTKLNVKFEQWRLGHDVVGPLIIVMAFTHSWIVGDDLELGVIQALWTTGLVLAAALFLYHRFIRPSRLKRRSYEVIDVQPEAENVWTVKMRPPEGEPVYSYLPGQFHFVTFYRGRGLPAEEHHWTISSSPAENGWVSSTIKALGDFTATIGQTKPGDRAAVHGAFGRFSYVLHPEEKELVFFAGGIGITPLMSMLRHMRDKKDDRSVLLIYANNDESQIIFRKELSEIESGAHPNLSVVHVLKEPTEHWQGETGLVDREKIKRLSGDGMERKVFYVCGPPPMLNAVVATLKELRVPDRNIRIEIFSFLD